MKLLRKLSELNDDVRGGALSIGNFDGVHRGHARIIRQLNARARALQGPAVVFTFDPHPVRLLRPDQAPPPLTWTERKALLLAELGVDSMVVYPTDHQLLNLEPEAFFERIVVQQLRARAMVEGPNFFFGRNRAGNVERLEGLCAQAGVQLEIVPPLEVEDAYVSSSRVRTLIAGGQVGAACGLLTRPYRIRGMVTHGAARGAAIGFPTANIDAVDTLLPGDGVYAGRAYDQQDMWPAAVNIGPNPTFAEKSRKVEAHLIGFEGSLYGKPLEVDFLARLRDIRPFPDVDALTQQLAKDVSRTKDIVKRQAGDEVLRS